MNHYRRHIVFGFWLATIPFLAHAQTYYVSPSGADSNSGDLSNPLKTISRASELAALPGDHVIVQAGDYPEVVVTSANGTEGNPITFSAQSNVTVQGFFIEHAYIVVEQFALTNFPVPLLAHIELFEGADHAIIRNNTISNSAIDDVAGIEVGPTVQDCSIIGNTIRNIRGPAITIRGTNHIVAFNTLSALQGFDGIRAFGRNHSIQSNLIADSQDTRADKTVPASAIRTWGLFEEESTNITFGANTVSNFQGYAGFLEQDKNDTNNVGYWSITGNRFHNITHPFVIKTPNTSFEHNTIIFTNTDGSAALELKEELIGINVYNSADGTTIRNNSFIASGARFSGSDSGYYHIDPLVTPGAISENFVTGHPLDNFPSKTGFNESNGINGGDPKLNNINDPLNGLRPLDSSRLCQTSSRNYIGALPCLCTNTVPQPDIQFETSNTPGSLWIRADASDSISCGKTITNYTWNFGDGASASGVSAEHTYANAGTKSVSLTVRNNVNQNSSTSKSIVLPVIVPTNKAPVIVSGGTRTVIWPVENAVLDDITISDDHLPSPPDLLTIAWTKVSGPGTVTFSSTFTAHTIIGFSSVGTYVVRVTASDSVLSSFADIELRVITFPNGDPVVDAGPDKTVTQPNSVFFREAQAVDDGFPNPPAALSMNWDKVSGPGSVTFTNTAVAQTTASFSSTGTYVLSLSAFDGEKTSSDTVQVTVQSTPITNTAPVVFAGSTKTITYPHELAVTYDATASDDGYPLIPGALTLQWQKVSGPGTVTFTSTNSIYTFVRFSQPGSYRIQLIANDGALSSASSVDITVVELGSEAPIVYAGESRRATLPTGVIQFDDADIRNGISNEYIVEWTQVSGPAPAVFDSTFTLHTFATVTSTGTYTFRLNAKQGITSASNDVTITVAVGYKLKIVNGLIDDNQFVGEGYFEEGVLIPIIADTPDENLEFDYWIGSGVVNSSASSTNVVMPAADTTITATFKQRENQGSASDSFVPFANVFNPVESPEIVISYRLVADSQVRLTVHTLFGDDVTLLANGPQSAGINEVHWNGKNGSGTDVAPGLYLVLLKTDRLTLKSKVAVIR